MNRRILIVEDDAIIASDLAFILQDAGFVAEYVVIANEAAAAAQRFKPDLLIMDIRLDNGRDGIALAREILTGRQTPVIFTSGLDNPLSPECCGEFAGCQVLMKPYDLRELIETVKRLLP